MQNFPKKSSQTEFEFFIVNFPMRPKLVIFIFFIAFGLLGTENCFFLCREM